MSAQAGHADKMSAQAGHAGSVKRVIVGLLAAALMVPVGAWADEPSTYGWWFRLRSRQLANPLGAEPTHPGVGDDEVLVAKDLHPDEPLAIAGLTYTASAGPSATLELQVAPNSIVGTPLVAACPSTQAFLGEFPGRWEDRPPPDCDLSLASGELLGEGESMLFNLPSDFMVFTEFWNIVLIPDPQADPFEVVFERPGDASFVVNADSGLPPGAPGPRPPDPTPNPVEDVPVTVGVVPVLPSTPPPTVAPSPAPEPTRAPVAQPARPAASVPDDMSERVIAVLILAVLGAGVWAIATYDARRASAKAGGGIVRGIGRFAKPRVGAPPRLV